VHILLVVGKFPELTFILRTAQGLAARGHRVTVAARSRGNWAPFAGDLPLPKTLGVKYLLPDQGFHDPRQAIRLVGAVWQALQAPTAAARLMQRCLAQPDMRPAALRHFIRYLPFMQLRPAVDVIQFDFPMTAQIYRWLPQLLKAPTVVSCRGSDVHMLEQRTDKDRDGRLSSLRDATLLHCVSDEMAATAARLSGRTEGIWVNRPAVPVDRISPKTYPAVQTAPCIIAVGNLTWIKGFDYLLAALARLKQAGVSFRAQIIGDGKLYPVLRFSIGDLDLTDQVELTGALPSAEVLRRMQEADLFVLSSHAEGISNAVLEAMASGLPIVTTTAGGMAEVVQDGVEGFVTPVRDITALTDRLSRMIGDVSLREQMGRAARARAEAEFSLERQVLVFEEMYQSIVEHPQA
jgi:glycosyltransferase involved in cell wall biosynthesis